MRAASKRRIAFVGAGAVVAVVIHLRGVLVVPSPVLAILAAWLVISVALNAVVKADWTNAQVWGAHTFGQFVDVLAALAVAHLLGATLWSAPLILALSMSLGGQVLPRTNAVFLGFVGSLGFAITLLAETRGVWPVTGPFATSPQPDQATAIGAIVIVSVAMLAIAAIQRTFLRQVAGMESRHARLLETAADIIATIDAEGRLLSVNRAFEDLLGWPRARVVGSKAIEFVDEPDRAIVQEQFNAVLRGETVKLDAHVGTLGQAFRVLGLTGAPILDERGRVVAVLGIARDVTEQRAEAVRLADSERQLRFLVQSMNETVCMFDAGARFTAVYGRWASEIPVAIGDMIGKTPADLLGEERGRVLVEQIQLALSGRTVEMEQDAKIAGTDRHFHLWFTPLRDDAGVTLGVTGVAYDITEQHRAEQERDVLSTRLEESRRIESIGRLVSGIAHEINNPLAAILTFAEQLRAEARTPVDAAALEGIHAQALRSRAIVRDLIAFVRPDQHRPVTAVRVAPFLDEIARSLSPHLTSLGVELTSMPHDDQVWVAGDAPGLEQAVTNLVLNAAQSAGTGGRVCLRSSSTDGVFSLVVEDFGPGIPAAAMPHLFEPFFTTKPVGQGTGLGLSVVMGIVQQHRGTVRAENRVGTDGPGARFIVELPRASAPATLPGPPARTTPVAAGPAPNGRGRVLLVDDEDAIRMSLRRFFTRRGWDVFDANSGGVALDILRRERADSFALVLCDLRMPGMGGAAVHAHIAKDFPGLLDRVVIVTGDVVSSDASAFLGTTSVRVLEKPFELRALGALADELLAQSRAGDEPAV
jgi:PAS domain S-box-containing protein